MVIFKGYHHLDKVKGIFTYLERFVNEDWWGQVDVNLDLLSFILWGGELGLVDKGRVSWFLGERHDRHTSHIHDVLKISLEDGPDLWALTLDFVVDVDLIIDADTGGLSKSLDAVSDLARHALLLELWGLLGVKHDICGTLGLTDPSLLTFALFCFEGLDDLKHAIGDLVAVDLDAAIA